IGFKPRSISSSSCPLCEPGFCMDLLKSAASMSVCDKFPLCAFCISWDSCSCIFPKVAHVAAVNKTVLHSDIQIPSPSETVTDCQIATDAHACFEGDAEIAPAAFKQGFKLRVAFKAHRHVAHFCPCGVIAGIVARRILALSGLFEFPEPLDKAVGAQFGVLAHLGFQLQGTPCWQGSVAIARCGLGRKLGVPLVDGLGIMGAMRPEFVEARASLLQFLDLFGRCGDVLRLRPQDRIHGAGMTDEGPATGAAQRRLRVDLRFLPGALS